MEELPSLVSSVSARARAAGALEPILTESVEIEDAGVRFVVRSVSSLARKRAAPARPDPLGDYERELFVADLPPAHYLLLNKYPVLPRHVLLVTRRFEPQEALLSAEDLAALERSLPHAGWLAFYNAGTLAGASQERKHLQLVPMDPIPVEPFLAAGGRLPFRHAFARRSARGLHDSYGELLAACGVETRPYNLLLTSRWMMVVPRRREHFESISVNALGFAGSLFARTREEVERIRAAGPMNVLRAVAGA